MVGHPSTVTEQGKVRVDGILTLQVLSLANLGMMSDLRRSVDKATQASQQLAAIARRQEDLLADVADAAGRTARSTERQEQIHLQNNQKAELNAAALEAIHFARQLLKTLSQPGNALERYVAAEEVYKGLNIPTVHISRLEDKQALEDIRTDFFGLIVKLRSEFTEDMWEDLNFLTGQGPNMASASRSVVDDPKSRRVFPRHLIWVLWLAYFISSAFLGSQIEPDSEPEMTVPWVLMLLATLILPVLSVYLIVRSMLRRLTLRRQGLIIEGIVSAEREQHRQRNQTARNEILSRYPGLKVGG
ncbi:hypothetical protein [Hyphomonas oceanitis]|uniref:hypothetical protein n=1 Tax=Hyphomonas oceanitis TaxID=81033 RepID=UPI0030030947